MACGATGRPALREAARWSAAQGGGPLRLAGGAGCVCVCRGGGVLVPGAGRGRRRWSERGGGEAAMKVNGAGGVRPAGRASFPSLRGGGRTGT